MKALLKVARGEGNVLLKDVPEPVPGEGEALIRVQVAGVCGTDVHIYHDRFLNSPPVILGHEFSGVVERVGPGVKAFRPGDRVVSENNPFACGVCRICSLGYPNLCPRKRAMGILSDGCFAEYLKLPVGLLHRIPDNLSFEEAALTEPLAVSVHSVCGRCGIEKGDTVVVFGPGAIGLLACQAARAEEAGPLLLVGLSQDEKGRFKCAAELGIETVNVEKEDVKEKVMNITGGVGADVVVEASGSEAAILLGLDLLRKNGRMAVSGLTGKRKIPLDWDKMVSKAVSIFFAYGSRKPDWQKALEFLSEKRVKTLPLITHRFTIEEWEKAFYLLETLQAIRPVFVIGETK